MSGCYACNGSGIVEDHDGDRPCLGCHSGPPCRLGYLEPDGFRYCYEHGGFANNYGDHAMRCDRKLVKQ
jgi:hypothetical protein